MITKFEKRVVAGVMAILMCISMMQVPVKNVNAQDVRTERAEVAEGIVSEDKSDILSKVTTEEFLEAVAGTKNQTEITMPNQTVRYIFRPEETGSYCLSIKGQGGFSLYEKVGENVKFLGGKSSSYNLQEYYEFKAGTDYYIDISCWSENEIGTVFWKIAEVDIQTIILNEKYSEDVNPTGEEAIYKFIPKESGKYVFLSSYYLNVQIYNQNGQSVGIYNEDKRIDFNAGETYYIKLWNSKALEWKLTKAIEIEIQLNTKYEMTSEQAVNYRFSPEQSSTYLFHLDNSGACTIYDSNWNTVIYGTKASLMAGETYYIVIIPKEKTVKWEMEMCKVSGEYSYKIQEDGTIEIAGYLGKESFISIPESIEGMEVTSIGEDAFNRNNIIEEVSIPACIRRVSGRAFANCENLKQVNFAPESKLEKIDNNAFYGCTEFSQIILPDSVKELGDGVFKFTRLTEIDIPDSIAKVGYSVFANCDLLQKVRIGKGLQKISAYMFWDCSKLEQIDFMKSGISNVTEIEYDAFRWCSSLEDIKFPETVKSVGANSMYETGWYNNQSEGTLYLNQILYGYKGEMIENTNITIENGTTVIADRAFKGRKGLKSVQLADTVENIGKFSFYGCNQMESIMISENVTEIGEFALGYIEGTQDDGQLVTDDMFATYVKKIENFTIQGYSGSAAEKYAKDNGFKFVSLGGVKPKKEFIDVAKTDWFYDAVMYVSENKIMTGLTEETFAPDVTLTRAQFATILYRVNGEPDIEYSAKFPDVADGQWYTKGVLWANSIGVVGGYNDGLFGPEDNITREQMALMMYRYAKHEGYDISKTADISSFEDASKVSSYAEEAFKWAVGNEIIGGKAGNKLDPQGKATRAECAAIMMRFMEKYEK